MRICERVFVCGLFIKSWRLALIFIHSFMKIFLVNCFTVIVIILRETDQLR